MYSNVCNYVAAKDTMGIRLIPEDPRNLSGIIEVSIRGEWRSVCDNKWSNKDAIVACRALGLPSMGKHFIVQIVASLIPLYV